MNDWGTFIIVNLSCDLSNKSNCGFVSTPYIVHEQVIVPVNLVEQTTPMN